MIMRRIYGAFTGVPAPILLFESRINDLISRALANPVARMTLHNGETGSRVPNRLERAESRDIEGLDGEIK